MYLCVILKNVLIRRRSGGRLRGERTMQFLSYVLQATPGMQGPQQAGMGGDFIFAGITAVSVLLVSVGILYVLMKLGRFLEALKEKT